MSTSIDIPLVRGFCCTRRAPRDVNYSRELTNGTRNFARVARVTHSRAIRHIYELDDPGSSYNSLISVLRRVLRDFTASMEFGKLLFVANATIYSRFRLITIPLDIFPLIRETSLHIFALLFPLSLNAIRLSSFALSCRLSIGTITNTLAFFPREGYRGMLYQQKRR